MGVRALGEAGEQVGADVANGSQVGFAASLLYSILVDFGSKYDPAPINRQQRSAFEVEAWT
jgi:hypothetical protein